MLTEFDDLLPLRAGLAVADVPGRDALVKWPNDVWIDGTKIAGILAESRSEPRWAVLGIGVNVAVDVGALPADAAAVAGSLGKSPRTSSRRSPRCSPRWRPAWLRIATARWRPARARRAARRAASAGRTARAPAPGSTTPARCCVTLPNGGQTTLSAGEVTLGA